MSKLLFILAGVCVAGLGAGFLATTLRPHDRLVIAPELIELQEPVIEGQPLVFDFVVHSEARSDITLTSVAGSCGCMVVTNKGKPLELPLTLPPAGQLPLRLNIATTARVGRQSFVLSVASSSAGSDLPLVQADVRANLLGTLRAEPSVVVFREAKPGESREAEIELADMLPDPGEQIREVTASRPEAMRIEIRSISGLSAVFGASVPAKKRSVLRLSYAVPDADAHVQDMISVRPADERCPVLQVPVLCQMAEAPYRLSPSGLTITAARGERFSRTAQLQHRAPVSFAVKEHPPSLDLNVTDSSPDTKLIRLSGVVPNDLSTCNVVFLLDGAEVTFPIRFAIIE